MRLLHTFLLPASLLCLCASLQATSGESITQLEFNLSFNASSDFKITTHSLAITGSLDGEGRHNERWGLIERAGDVAYGVETNIWDHTYLPDNLWGPLWGTQTLTTDSSCSLSMLTQATALYAPSSFAWAKSNATPGVLATVTNLSDAPKEFSFTVSRDFAASIAALADPGEYAFAEADWNFSFSQKLGDTSTALFKSSDHIEVSASLEAGLENKYLVSSILHFETKEATFKTWLDAGETTTFTLDSASLHSHGLTAPDGGSLLGVFSATLGLLIFFSRRRTASGN